MDKATWLGIVLGVGAIVGGLLLERGSLSQVMQPTAAMIVFGGTFGAVLIQFPLAIAVGAYKRLAQVFIQPSLTPFACCRSWSGTPTKRAARALSLWTPACKESKILS